MALFPGEEAKLRVGDYRDEYQSLNNIHSKFDAPRLDQNPVCLSVVGSHDASWAFAWEPNLPLGPFADYGNWRPWIMISVTQQRVHADTDQSSRASCIFASLL